jgi:phenylalanine-4-hydroxylase
MNEVEEKKIEVQRIDPLYFVVRELDSLKVTTKDEFNKVYKEFEKVYKEFDKVYTTIENLRLETKDEFNKVYKELRRSIPL